MLLFVMLVAYVLFAVVVYVVCCLLVFCCVFEFVVWRLVQVAGGCVCCIGRIWCFRGICVLLGWLVLPLLLVCLVVLLLLLGISRLVLGCWLPGFMCVFLVACLAGVVTLLVFNVGLFLII